MCAFCFPSHICAVPQAFPRLFFVFLAGGSGQFNRNLYILLTSFYRKLIQNIRRIIRPLLHPMTSSHVKELFIFNSNVWVSTISNTIL